ncbi:MAG: DUF6531 domain-containing protein, partial [Firmicutes bacterium]|nr:DUF6531 domain-containing protein [Bacillota bacterium]
MDNSKIWQQELTYSCGAGAARVNLFTGRLLFEHHDFTMGAGNFQVDLSHVYNSHSPTGNLCGNRFATQMGQRWKLNIQQYIYQHGGNWRYVDANGMEHEFAPLGDGRFYDTSGLGLILDPQTASARTIVDELGNILTFDASGRLTRGRLGVCSQTTESNQIAKIYNYNSDNNLKSIQDARHNEQNINRRLEFGYAGERLTRIELKEGETIHQRLNFTYDNNNLVCIRKTAWENDGTQISKVIAYFTYHSNGLLESVVDGEDLSCLRFTYDGSNRVSSVTTGVLSEGGNISITVPSVTGQIMVGSALTGATTTNFTFNQIDVETMVYNTEYFENAPGGHTVVTKNEAIRIEYYYRYEGEFIAALERNNAWQANENFRTVFPNPDEGIRLDDAIAPQNHANFDTTPIRTGSNPLLISTATAINEFNQMGEGWRRYKVSCWVRATGEIAVNPFIKVRFGMDDDSHYNDADLRMSANSPHQHLCYLEDFVWINGKVSNIVAIMGGSVGSVQVMNLRATPVEQWRVLTMNNTIRGRGDFNRIQ